MKQSDLNFLKGVARDYGHTIDDEQAKRAYNVLKNEWGVNPDSSQFYYAAKEYFGS